MTLTQEITGQLTPWSHPHNGFTLRGWMTPNCGHNNRPVIHFLHGNGFSGLTYWPFLKQFMSEYDLFINSIEGHGNSDPNPAKRFVGWNALASRTLAAYESLSHGWEDVPVISLSHSFGSILNILMLRQQQRPFDQYIMLDPVVYPKAMVVGMRLLSDLKLAPHFGYIKKVANRRAQWPDRAAVWKNFYRRGIFKHWQDDALNAYIDDGLETLENGQLRLRCNPWLEANIFGGYPKKLWPAIKRLPADTHIIYSQKTYPFIAPAVKKAAVANRNIHLTTVAGGHCFTQEAPVESYQLVKAKIRG